MQSIDYLDAAEANLRDMCKLIAQINKSIST